MKIQLTAYKEAFSKLPEGIQAAEVCADLREELLISVKNGEQTGGESFSRTTLYLRASGDRTGTVLTENIDDDPYELMKKAMDGAAYARVENPEPMISGEPFCQITGDDHATVAEVRESASRMEAAAKNQKEVSRILECSLRKTIFARRVLNSLGLDRYQEHTGYLASLSIRIDQQNGSSTEGKAERYVPSLDTLNVEKLAEKALEHAKYRDGGGNLPKVHVPTGSYAAVLSTDVVRNVMITAWMAFTADRLQNKSSAFSASGEEIGSGVLNIVDNPRPQNWSVDYTLDSQGVLCQKKDIVREGKLIHALHTPASAKAGGTEPTGNTGRVAGLSGNTPISAIPIPSCIYIEPGESTVEELLERMGTGIYLTYSLDVFHSINIASGEFSIPCGGIVYENGKAVGTADQLTIAGNLRNLMKDILAVANDLTLEEFMFYHNYSYGGPSILVRELAFAGKSE